jgi:hypothetical protein
MNRKKFTLSVLATFVFVIACATAAQAQAQRTFVAGPGIGLDTNNTVGQGYCSFTNPCRNFSVAFAVTNTGGEIIAISPGVGYGGLSINRSITVTGLPGSVAFVAVGASTTGFSVAPGVTDLVVLRNLYFNGSNSASSTGLSVSSGNLVLENCNFSQLATGFRGTGGNIVARNSSFLSNSTRGVHLSGTAKMDLEDCNISFNAKGVTVDGSGGCPNPGTFVASTTAARLNRGIVSNNTTFAFEMLNPGPTPCSPTGHGQNIFLRINSSGTDFSTNVPGYSNSSTNFLFVTGVASAAQVLIGTYNNNNQGRQP